MVSDPQQKLWLYVVNNDGFFRVSDVIGDCSISEIGLGYQGGGFGIENVAAFEPQNRGLIRPSDAHTFRCPSFRVENPPTGVHGKVDVRVNFQYAGIFPVSERACYQLEPDGTGGRIWVRQACP